MGNRKFSKKREAILELIKSTKEHPSAEWIYNQLKPEFPDLSLGTVYRNINLFRDSGDIVCIGSFGGQERFDAYTEPHPHFVCEKCNGVIDLDIAYSGNHHYSDIEEQLGCEIRHDNVFFSGICNHCRA